MDVHIRRAITEGLRRRDVDVLTAQDDGSDRLPDAELLDRALALSRVVFSQDEDISARGIGANNPAKHLPASSIVTNSGSRPDRQFATSKSLPRSSNWMI